MNSATMTIMLLLALGFGLAVAGIYLLAGLGWALLFGALGPFALATILMRGVSSG